MKSYLSLIPISAGVRRKQSKKIILCIVLAVFLVTVIFSLAEAGLKMELNASVDKKGYWHICVKGIQEGDAREIAGRDDVAAASWYDVLNLDEDLNMDKEYYMEGARTALCGIEDSFIGEIMHYFSEGAHVGNGNEVILTENARELLGVETGDRITLNTPAGDYDFVISGFRITGGGKYVSSNGGQTSALLVKDDQIGAFMDIETFRSICEDNGETGNPQYYIRFGKQTGLKKAVGEIRERYGLTDSDVELNTILMAACGISNSKYIKNVYPIAAVLFLLILAAGVMMISGSMNSDAARRLQFFGMLRCIGASRSQIIRLVRLEALNWCKSAVPLGTALGVLAAWLICAGLKYIVGGEFTDIPVLRVSAVGVLSGAAVGSGSRRSSCRIVRKKSAVDDGFLCAQHCSVLLFFGAGRIGGHFAATESLFAGYGHYEHTTAERYRCVSPGGSQPDRRRGACLWPERMQRCGGGLSVRQLRYGRRIRLRFDYRRRYDFL